MLKEIIDGKEYVLSAEKEKLIRDKWALVEKYPEYRHHICFDWITPAFHNMEECIKHHSKLMEQAHDRARKDLDKQIELAQENSDPTLPNLYVQRKNIRSHLQKDYSDCKTIDDLRNSIPENLKPYWNNL